MFSPLTLACARSRCRYRARMTGSRNTRCTFWPEIQRCRRAGELRWSAWSPSRLRGLPGLIASDDDLLRSGLLEKNARFTKPEWNKCACFSHLLRCIFRGMSFLLCQPTHTEQNSCRQSGNKRRNSYNKQKDENESSRFRKESNPLYLRIKMSWGRCREQRSKAQSSGDSSPS